MQQLQVLPLLPKPGMPIVPRDEWIQGFQNFLLATDCAHAKSARRCALLIHFLGCEGQRIVRKLGFDALTFDAVTSVDIPREDARDIEASSASTSTVGSLSQAVGENVLALPQDGFQRLVTHLRNQFVRRKNVMLERRRFRNRSQTQGEEISRFVAALWRLAATCDFGAIPDSILCDQLIEGIASRRLRTRLYAERQPPTFRRAVDVAIVFVSSSPVVPRWRPVGTAINESRSHPIGSSCVLRTVYIKSFIPPDKENEKSVDLSPNFASTADDSRIPEVSVQLQRRLVFPVVVVVISAKYAIGMRSRIRQDTRNVLRVTQFPVEDDKTTVISFCNRQNFVAVRNVQGDVPLEDNETASVFPVRPVWWQGIQVNAQVHGRSLTFLLDTGSALSIIDEWTFNRHFSRAEILLRAPPKQLLDYNRRPIPVLGSFTAKANVETRSADILFYVVPQGKTLVGLDATHLLKFIISGEHLNCKPEVMVQQSDVPTASPSCATMDVKPGSRGNERSLFNTVKNSITPDERNSEKKSDPHADTANVSKGDKRNADTPDLYMKETAVKLSERKNIRYRLTYMGIFTIYLRQS